MISAIHVTLASGRFRRRAISSHALSGPCLTLPMAACLVRTAPPPVGIELSTSHVYLRMLDARLLRRSACFDFSSLTRLCMIWAYSFCVVLVRCSSCRRPSNLRLPLCWPRWNDA